jgi:hypothetical protein
MAAAGKTNIYPTPSGFINRHTSLARRPDRASVLLTPVVYAKKYPPLSNGRMLFNFLTPTG